MTLVHVRKKEEAPNDHHPPLASRSQPQTNPYGKVTGNLGKQQQERYIALGSGREGAFSAITVGPGGPRQGQPGLAMATEKTGKIPFPWGRQMNAKAAPGHGQRPGPKAGAATNVERMGAEKCST